MVRVEGLLFHKGDATNSLPNAITYRCVPRYGYCVSCTDGMMYDMPQMPSA